MTTRIFITRRVLSDTKEADMSGFRKFRSSLHRRRRSIEAVELGFLTPSAAGESTAGAEVVSVKPMSHRFEPETTPLEFSPSAEAREIGPNPIGWLKSRRPETDN